MVGGVAVGVDGGGRGGASSQRLQTFLVPHVGSSGPTAVRRRQIQRRAALQGHTQDVTVLQICGLFKVLHFNTVLKKKPSPKIKFESFVQLPV